MDTNELETKLIQGVETLEGTFSDLARNLANILADKEMGHPNQLMSKTSFLERFQTEIRDELKGTQNRLKNGPISILHALIELQKDESQADQIIEDFGKLTNLASLILEDRQNFIDELARDKSLQDIAGISNASLEKMYKAAKYLFDQQRFEEAADAFGFLTMLNSQKFAFWLGLGNSEFQLKKYKAALWAYAFVCRVNPADYYSHIFSCRCYEALDELENAMNALELALYVLEDIPENKELKLTIELHLKRLELALHKRGGS